MLLGQVFGYGAVVRSGLALDAGAAREVAAALVGIAEKKSFLREVAGEAGGAGRGHLGRGTRPIVWVQGAGAGCAWWALGRVERPAPKPQHDHFLVGFH